jgi:hypothetical protein
MVSPCLTVCLRMSVGFSFLCAEGLSSRTNLFYFFVFIFLIKYIFILYSIVIYFISDTNQTQLKALMLVKISCYSMENNSVPLFFFVN